MSLKIFTAFTGIGSPEMALKNIGMDFEIVGMSEVDRYALLAYDAIHNDKTKLVKYPSKEAMLEEFKEKNIGYNFSTGKSEIPRGINDIENLYSAHKRNKNFGDIKKIIPENLPYFDLFTYSFPCKDISVAGKQKGLKKGAESQSSLLWYCEEIITKKKPPFLLMENVKNLVGSNHLEDFKVWIEVLKSLGYTSHWKVLNGKDFGVPQKRERVIMVSTLDKPEKEFEFNEGFPLETHLYDLLERDVEQSKFMNPERYKDHKDPLPSQEISYCIDANYYKGTSVEGFIKKRRRQLVMIKKDLKEGENMRQEFTSYEDFAIRKLTPLECWRLMGYSDEDFYNAKTMLSNTKLYERAGRGIVVPMLETVFENLFLKNK